MFICNYRKCRQPLKVNAVATVCKHIFCVAHSPLKTQILDGAYQCPACRSKLKENYDIIEVLFIILILNDKVDLEPCEQLRNMILMGQTPDIIFDICRRAIEFYNFQKIQETKFFEYVNFKLEEKYRNFEMQCKCALSEFKNQNTTLRNEKIAVSFIIFKLWF